MKKMYLSNESGLHTRRLLICVYFVMSLLLLGSCKDGNITQGNITQQKTFAKIKNERKLRVAYINYPPTVYRDLETGKITGLFVDILEDIIRQVDPNIEIIYEETTWADFTAALSTRRVDLSIAGTFTTIPRAKVVSFTNPIVYLGRSAIVKKNDTRFEATNGPEQFDRSDIKIGVVSGEGSHEYVKANFKNLDNIVVFQGSDLSQCLAAVSAGQIDVGMSDALETQKYAKAHPEVKDLYGASPYNLTPIAWAVRHEDYIFLNFLNTALRSLDVSRQITKWESKYDFKWTYPIISYGLR